MSRRRWASAVARSASSWRRCCSNSRVFCSSSVNELPATRQQTLQHALTRPCKLSLQAINKGLKFFLPYEIRRKWSHLLLVALIRLRWCTRVVGARYGERPMLRMSPLHVGEKILPVEECFAAKHALRVSGRGPPLPRRSRCGLSQASAGNAPPCGVASHCLVSAARTG